MSIYLEDLTTRLTTGASRLSPQRRIAHAAYFRSAQQPDGGFAGREGGSDLYYTGFALRGLALCDDLPPEVAEPAARYLREQLTTQATIVDFISLLYGALLLQVSAGVNVFEEIDENWPSAVAQTLEQLRRDDGGYAKSREGAASSTYHSFLVVLCLQLISQPVPEPEKLISFTKSRQREDGGFVEIPQMRRSGTNPTSAAVALLRILGGLDDNAAERAANYLADQQSPEGGIQANTRIAVADTLSTFTGLLTLADLDCTDWINLAKVQHFTESMELPNGGFRGAVLDPACDVEYTFYGLGTLALLQELTQSPA